MTTLSDVLARVADQLARSDLTTQITREIQLAIERYNRRVTWLHELRECSLTSVAAQTWYTSVDVSTGAGPQDVAGRTAVDVADIQKISLFRTADGTHLRRSSVADFERMYDGGSAGGTPVTYTLYAGQIGLWPAPSGIETFTLSAVVKPVIPSQSTDESVWFERAQELIENAACAAVCRKFIQDGDRAQAYAVYEAQAFDDLLRESAQKMATGRLKVHD